MKEFKISDDLVLRRSWNGSAMQWYLLRFRRDPDRATIIRNFIELSDEEAEAIVAKIQKIMKIKLISESLESYPSEEL